jgi:hypothetical protein
MPFTISHVAAVMPFSRPLARWRVLSATVIGAMVPDFHIFSPFRIARWDTHSLLALLTWCLPVGLLCYWLFQYLLKRPMIELLPDGAYGRWQNDIAPRPMSDPVQWLLAALGILVGAVTHDSWDAFTHEGARGVRLLAMLDEPLFDSRLKKFIVAGLAQDLSSLFGLILVITLIAYELNPRLSDVTLPRPIKHLERVAWVSSYFVISGILSVPIFLWMRYGDPHPRWVPGIVNDMAIASLRGLAIAMVVFCAALLARLPARPDQRSSPPP